MCNKYFAILCCVLLLLVTSSSKSQQIFTNNKEKDDNLTIRFEVDTNSTTNYNDEIILRYDLYKKFTNKTQNNGMPYKFPIISTKNDQEDFDSMSYKLSKRSVHNREDNDQILINFHTNLTNVNHKGNFTSQEVYENLIKENNFTLNKVFENSSKNTNESINIIPYEMCHNVTCILLCCPLGNRMRMDDECIPEKNEFNFFPNDIFINDSLQSGNKRDELFHLAVYDSCQKKERFLVDKNYQYDYKIFANGSIYLSHYKILFKSTSYCLASIVDRGDKFEVTFCSETYDMVYKNAIKYAPEIRSRYEAWSIYAYFRATGILFLVPIILVYSILPELRNVHGFMLCNYCTASCLAHVIYLVNISQDKADLSYPACIALAFSEYFCVMSSHSWLSVMSFNMWRIFRH
ncbi:G-protein coupled receptor Mth2-like [Nylanderia fulva]|uniref:G-protein coupled receptor Mth2-like n=1 Tax=Nylanderia fulva TaxID=613905 RepID=UPI0010FBB94D|nr:G-protein coupled receptor Mth2-like [Nylanderia fulva]